MPLRHFDEELSDLKTKLLRMAAQAEDQIDKALTALVTRDCWPSINLPREICGS
jgi:phosphate uptake regulator